ncbi:MAG: sugar phosphate isomerase/epimerase family protein [Lentisphaeria bacterium]|jgi:sugar phosphate isomerase/epimerase|nr:sugar phosphate isomerase/epimerase family protein [Lentisphaeria bacterium]
MQFKGYFTGFADEAGKDLATQIRATKELGWSRIESRNIDGKNIHDLSDAEFDAVYGALLESGVSINCFGSSIANWGKQITDPFDSSLAEARRAIPRMRRLGTKLVRIMSFAVLKDRGPEDQMAEERFRRVRELCRMFGEEGITPVHENCMNYGGMGYTYTLRLLENVPGLKLVFDTGNPVFSDDRSKPAPYPKQSAYTFYKMVKEQVAYIHIKDGIWDAAAGKTRFTYPGEGHGDVPEILADLIGSGYAGGISIEPHLAVVFHDASVQSEVEVRFANYVEYGRRLERLIAGL